MSKQEFAVDAMNHEGQPVRAPKEEGTMKLPHHGGDLAKASEDFGIPLAQWVDLSTGISPWSWPIPELPEQVWRRLPPRKDGLEAAAQRFYQSKHPLFAVPGSQWAIAQLCPALLDLGEIRPGQRVGVPARGYQEHRFAWAQAGVLCVEYEDMASLKPLLTQGEVDHAVVIDPNNPTGEACANQELRELAQQLEAKRGWLVVDQAFADLQGKPVIDLGPRVVIMRSLGKFFGLAGLRVGFVAAAKPLQEKLQAKLGPWGLAHPARFIAEKALLDEAWHRWQRDTVATRSEAWHRWLTHRLDHPVINAGLFFTLKMPAAECQRIYQRLGESGVLVRIFQEREGKNLMRLGLPESSEQSQWEAWFGSV